MNLIAEMARLKEPFVWQPIGVSGHYKIVPGVEEDKTLAAMLAVAGQFQAGHAAALIEIADILEQAGFVAKAAYIRPLIEAAKVMEGE